jgi:NTE family protein
VEWIDEGDGVFRGGGVKGIALAGALSGFAGHPEKPVRRWVNVAGASAGAIIAAYLAVGHTADEMVALLRSTPFASFQDFPGGHRWLAPVNFARRHGMAHGEAFARWFDGVLQSATFGAVRAGDAAGAGWRLKMVAVDVTSHRLLVLPDDLVGYRRPGSSALIDPDEFPIARAARMSMSIPYFFEPVRLDDAKGRTCTIVDGGTLSNFPVWLFDVDPAVAGRPPSRPTFGFTLTGGKGVGGGFGALGRLAPWPVRFGAEIFHTATTAWDDRFVSHSTRTRTVTVDALGVATTDFALPPPRTEALVESGRRAAKTFLDAFDLAAYMNTFHASVVPAPASA